MHDSFFSARNYYDPQVADANRFACSDLMEATTRRMVHIAGPIEAARLNYRLADICAGANVVPLELLVSGERERPAEDPPPPPTPAWAAPTAVRRREPLLDRIMPRAARFPLLWFYAGLLCGWLIFGR